MTHKPCVRSHPTLTLSGIDVPLPTDKLKIGLSKADGFLPVAKEGKCAYLVLIGRIIR